MRTREYIGIVVFGKRAVFGRMRTFSLLVVSMISLYVELFFSTFFPFLFFLFYLFLNAVLGIFSVAGKCLWEFGSMNVKYVVIGL